MKLKWKEYDYIQMFIVLLSLMLIFYSGAYLINYYYRNDLLYHIPETYQYDLKTNKKNQLSPNEVGDSIGGILNPIIGISGAVLTFLAFYIQYRTNKTQIKLFDTNQKEQNKINERDLFFRLIDNLNNKIFNTRVIFENKDYQGFSGIDSINRLNFQKLNVNLSQFGRRILAAYPGDIEERFFVKMVRNGSKINVSEKEDAKKLKEDLSNLDSEGRNEFLKSVLGYREEESLEIQETLKYIAIQNFYTIPFNFRLNFYDEIYEDIYNNFATIIDSYIKGLNPIFKIIQDTTDNESRDYYYSHLKTILSNQELCLIFYYCASGQSNKSFRLQIRNLDILTNELNKYRFFISNPTPKELKSEIEYILKRDDVVLF